MEVYGSHPFVKIIIKKYMFIQNYFGLISTIICFVCSIIGFTYHGILKKHPENSLRLFIVIFMIILLFLTTFAWYLKQNGMDIQIITVK